MAYETISSRSIKSIDLLTRSVNGLEIVMAKRNPKKIPEQTAPEQTAPAGGGSEVLNPTAAALLLLPKPLTLIDTVIPAGDVAGFGTALAEHYIRHDHSMSFLLAFAKHTWSATFPELPDDAKAIIRDSVQTAYRVNFQTCYAVPSGNGILMVIKEIPKDWTDEQRNSVKLVRGSMLFNTSKEHNRLKKTDRALYDVVTPIRRNERNKADKVLARFLSHAAAIAGGEASGTGEGDAEAVTFVSFKSRIETELPKLLTDWAAEATRECDATALSAADISTLAGLIKAEVAKMLASKEAARKEANKAA